MATKTITLELDAYEKLCAAKKAGESFTEVIRRAEFTEAPLTGARLLTYLASGGSGVSERTSTPPKRLPNTPPSPTNSAACRG